MDSFLSFPFETLVISKVDNNVLVTLYEVNNVAIMVIICESIIMEIIGKLQPTINLIRLRGLKRRKKKRLHESFIIG